MEPDTDKDTDLVDLLYGELDEGARARAASRVQSDPGLERTLDEWRRVRVLARNWHDDTSAEPSGRVDDLLSAAAAHVRRQPTAAAEPPRRGWWERVREWMAPLMAHPGLAAAASVVVIAGVVGSLYLGGNRKLAEPTARSEVSPGPTMTAAPAAPPPAPPPADMDLGAVGEGAPEQAATPPAIATGGARGGGADRQAERKRAKMPERTGPVRSDVDDGELNGYDGTRGRASRAPAPAAPLELPAAEPPPPPSPASDPAPEPVATPTGSAPASKPEKPRPTPPARKAQERAPSNEMGDSAAADKKEQLTEVERLTLQAQNAARAGRCGEVEKLSLRVKGIDEGFHRRRFVVDRDIAVCFAAKK